MDTQGSTARAGGVVAWVPGLERDATGSDSCAYTYAGFPALTTSDGAASTRCSAGWAASVARSWWVKLTGGDAPVMPTICVHAVSGIAPDGAPPAAFGWARDWGLLVGGPPVPCARAAMRITTAAAPAIAVAGNRRTMPRLNHPSPIRGRTERSATGGVDGRWTTCGIRAGGSSRRASTVARNSAYASAQGAHDCMWVWKRASSIGDSSSS